MMFVARGENARSAKEENAKDVTASAENVNGSLARKPWNVNERGCVNARENVAAFRFYARRRNVNDKNVCGWNASGSDYANSRDSGNASDKNVNEKGCFKSDDSARIANDCKESARGWNENVCRDSSERESNAKGLKNVVV